MTSVSRFRTWPSSCASTARSSRGDEICRIPVVAATTACCGSRPVANAFGAAWSMTKTRGIGMFESRARPATVWYSSGASLSDTSRAPANASAMRSLNQYAETFMTTARPSAKSAPPLPPNCWPARTRSPERSARRKTVFRVLNISYLHRELLGRGLAQPVFETRRAESRVIVRNECVVAQLRAEVARSRVGDDFARIVACAEVASNELVKAEPFGPRHLNGAVHGHTDRDASDRISDIGGRHRLDEHRC